MINYEEQRRKFPIGSIVYFVDRAKSCSYRKYVNYGVIKENYGYELYVERLVVNTLPPKIDDVSVEEMSFPTKWRKLPKGWTYDTKLFDYECGDIPNKAEIKNIDLKKPNDIIRAIDLGCLTTASKIHNFDYRPEIDKKYGWRIEQKSKSNSVYPYFSLPADFLYTSYEEAEAVIKAEEKELIRISNLTDEEWAIEEIDKTLNRWWKGTESEKKRVKEFLLSLPKIDEIETRLYGNGVQWKREKNKTWSDIVV